MATVAAVARGAGARAAAGLRGGSGAAARGRPRASCARRLCTAPAAVDMKRYLWERYHEAKRSTDGECAPQPAPPPGDARSPHPTSAARLPPAEKASPKLPNSGFPCPCRESCFHTGRWLSQECASEVLWVAARAPRASVGRRNPKHR